MSQAEELHFFNKLAKDWWDPEGPQAMLHKINPLRVRWMSRSVNLQGLKVLDVGCGAGILSEALAERGADVTGIDLGEELIQVAQSRDKGVKYQCIAIADFAKKNALQFDCVACLEMLEHVEDFAAILQEISKVLKPRGFVFLSTLDRTPRSFIEAIVGAEYLLKLVPKGTHHYAQFIRPDELCEAMRNAHLQPEIMTGLHYHPVLKTFSLTPKLKTNYWVMGQKGELS